MSYRNSFRNRYIRIMIPFDCRYFVYIAANANRTIYVGVTSDLEQRVQQHRDKAFAGFTAKYDVSELVYFEEFGDVRDAIEREKQIKGYRRAKKWRSSKPKTRIGKIWRKAGFPELLWQCLKAAVRKRDNAAVCGSPQTRQCRTVCHSEGASATEESVTVSRRLQ